MVKPRENRVPIMMSDEELSAIDDWRYANRIGTRSDAVRRLVQIGLRFDRHFDALYASIIELNRLIPSITDDINKAVQDKEDESYNVQALLTVVLGFMNQNEGHKDIINLIYGILGETAALKDEKATAEAIVTADESAQKYYAEIEKALKPLAQKWENYN